MLPINPFTTASAAIGATWTSFSSRPGCMPTSLSCVFRIIVTDRFGSMTAEFGNVTGDSGNVTDGVFAPA